jgi:predicted DCC family thiol-disulfide oxidoreductase YuxK
MSATPTIVYFDGVCGFCNRTVDRLLRLDRESRLRFAPLQGETARANLAAEDVANLDSLVVTQNGRTYKRSAAAVRVLWEMGGLSQVLGWLLWLIPLPIRDLGYRLIARVRYRLFGKLESCRLPQQGEAERFLP